MITYKEFLNQFDIINEEDFNNIIKSLPDNGKGIEAGDIDLYMSDLDNVDEVCKQFLNLYLQEFACACIGDVNYSKRTILLFDVTSLEDLEAIRELFSNWTIENYDEIAENLKKLKANKIESKILCDKIELIRPLLNILSFEEVKNIVKTYEQK